MIGKNIDEITEADLQALISNSVAEAKTIDYKQSLPGSSDSNKKEFLADVSSFANASGGDIVYGLTEEKGIPKSLDGLEVENVDQEILRLESIVRDGIEPRISIRTRPLPLRNSKVALIMRIPKSWLNPHRVIFGGHDKFYSRSSNGKYALDVAELRVAFNLSETIAERIRRFNMDRASKILANETPIPIYENAKIVLHLIPLISFNPGQGYDISEIASHAEKLKPIYCSGWNNRYNLDGVLAYSAGAEKSHSYVQLYRNGIIEAVEALLLRPHTQGMYIPSIAYERELIKSLSEYLSILQGLEVELPILVFVDLLGVKGFRMGLDREKYDVDELTTIDRDILLLPEVVVEDYKVRAQDILKPCFDSIWNACGFPRSFNYNDKGEWSPS